MSRPQEIIKQSLIAKLPPGFALAKRGGVIDALYTGFAGAFADGEKAAEDMLVEINPRSANYLLEDFERVLGPDLCGRARATRRLSNANDAPIKDGQPQAGNPSPILPKLPNLWALTLKYKSSGHRHAARLPWVNRSFLKANNLFG